jgi:hypothetical protein
MRTSHASISAFIIILLTVGVASALLTPKAASEDLPEPQWRLLVTGLVDNPLNLSLSELKTMPTTAENATLYCVDYPGVPVIQGTWVGVKLSYLLGQAQIQPQAFKVAFQAADNYTTDLSLPYAFLDSVILAYENNGAPLAETLRLVVPNTWGYKWISQVTQIDLVDYDYLGTWESRGYSDTGRHFIGENWAVRPPVGTPSVTSPPTPQPTPTPEATPVPSSTPTPTPSQSPSPTTIQTLKPTPSPQQTSKPTTQSNASNNDAFSLLTLQFAATGILLASSVLVALVLIRKKKQGKNFQTA